MAISTGVQTLSAEAVETLSASKHEPTWMRDRRLAAWQLSEGLALPLGTEEEWRRTDLRGLELEHYLPLPPQVAAVQRREDLSAFFVEHMTLPETPVGGLVVAIKSPKSKVQCLKSRRCAKSRSLNLRLWTSDLGLV